MSKEYIKAQTPLPAYFPYPKFLLQMSLSHTARLTYVLLLDRMTLSQKNSWVDAQGRAYVLYPLARLAADLQSSISSVTRALRELEAARLIERRSNGFSKPNQIFLGVPQTVQKCAIGMVKNEQPDCAKVSNTITQNCTPNQINKNDLRWNKINRTKEAYGRYQNVFLENYSEYRPFGFLSDPNDCHKLILDPVASRYVRLISELALQGNRTGTIAKILNEKQIPTPAAYHVAENHVYSEQKAWDLQRSHWTSGTVYHVLKNEKYKGTYVGAKFIMPVPCKHRVLRAPLEQQVRIEDSHAAIVTPEEFEQAQMVIMLQHGKHQAGNYTKHQYPLKGKVYCGYCQKLMKYRVLKKLGPSFNCRFSATAVDNPCKRIPISEELLEEIVRNALTVQIKQAEHVLEILHERERKALICFSALERQEEKLSAEKAELVKLRVALYEQYADGNMSKEEFIRQRDAYRVQEDDKMEQIQRLRTEKNQIFQPVKKDTDNLQAVMNTVGEAGDVMHLSQNVVETFIDRIEVFNDECVKIRFTFEDVLKSYEAE